MGISTIDGFQGREKDIVILSCVRGPNYSNQNRDDSHSIGFVKDWRRLNVAITRSKYALWIVGNAQILSNGDIVWKNLINHARKRGSFIHRSSRSQFFIDKSRDRDSARYYHEYERDRDFIRVRDYDLDHQRGRGRDWEVWDHEKNRNHGDFIGNRSHYSNQNRDVGNCRLFQRTGRCKWGDNCKYLHQAELQNQGVTVIENSNNVAHRGADGRETMYDIVSESSEAAKGAKKVVESNKDHSVIAKVP